MMREYRPRNILKSKGEVGAEDEVKGTSLPLLLFGGYITVFKSKSFYLVLHFVTIVGRLLA